MQMDAMQLKMKRKEINKYLVVLYPKCGNKHDKNECPLDVVDACGICATKNPTDKCGFLPPLKAVLRGQGPVELMEPLFYMNKKKCTI